MKKNLFALFAVLLLAILPGALAMSVDVNGVTYSGSPISVKLGETMPVAVEFYPTVDSNDTTITAEISYGHGKHMSVVSDAFYAIAGTDYKETLNIAMPTNVEVTPPGESYTLSIAIKDGHGNLIEFQPVPLTVQKENDLLDIQKVMAQSSVDAGKPMLVDIVVKNVGTDNQDDVYVSVEIPTLGVNAQEYVGDLYSVDNDEGKDTAVISVPIKIPSTALSGAYVMTIRASNGNVDVSKKVGLNVNGIAKDSETSDAIPTVTEQTVGQGKTASYEISVVNLGTSAKTYSVEISGTDGWASYSINPSAVSLQKDARSQLNVYLTAQDKATAGTHTFTATVKSSDGWQKQFTFTANVEAARTVDPVLISVIVLAIILVVLIAIFVKSRSKPEALEDEETYY